MINASISAKVSEREIYAPLSVRLLLPSAFMFVVVATSPTNAKPAGSLKKKQQGDQFEDRQLHDQLEHRQGQQQENTSLQKEDDDR